MVQWAYETEEQILLFVQNHMRNAILTPCMEGGQSAWRYGEQSGFCFRSDCFCGKKWRKTGEMGISAVALSVLVNNLFLKHFVARSRPFTVIEALVPLIKSQRIIHSHRGIRHVHLLSVFAVPQTAETIWHIVSDTCSTHWFFADLSWSTLSE